MLFTGFLLMVSVVCSTARAVFSKKLKATGSMQALLFIVASAVVFIVYAGNIRCPAKVTVVLSVFYGIFTFLSQWMYTIALAEASVSVCAMVYSFGFIIPTVFGTIVWREPINAFRIISILLCVFTIILASHHKEETTKDMHGLPTALFIAMISSGGLGVVQKIQQKTSAADETGMFLFGAFILAALLSAIIPGIRKDRNLQGTGEGFKIVFHIIIVGTAMAAANIANTLLSGRLPSAVVFPIVNVGVILASFLVSVLILREKMAKTQLAAFALGIVAILLFSI